jgi:hypothetical protein
VGVHGTDLAAQTYRTDIVKLYGVVLWDPRWYGGNFPFGYSVLSPVLGALVGVGVLTVVAAIVATVCFDRLTVALIGRRTLGSWYFAASTVLAVTIGQVPYLSGEAAALAAGVALIGGRRKLAVALGLVSVLLSPLAGAFLVMVCLIWALYDGRRRRLALAVAIVCTLGVGVLGLAFPGTGPFPFGWGGLVIVELLCATVLSPLVRAPKPIKLTAALYGLASLGAFVVPNPIGGNATRLAESFGIPVVACLVTAPAGQAWERVTQAPVINRLRSMSGRTVLGLIALVPFVIWQWAPGLGVVASAAPAVTKSSTAAFYQPLVRQLQRRSDPGPIRVEVVPTVDHWEAAYVAPYVSLARGWERQLDVADNPIFYQRGGVTPTTYRKWLLNNGVSYVALTTAPLDYAGKSEAAVLRSGKVKGLRLVWSSSTWRLWQVLGTPGLVAGPGHLQALAPDMLSLDVTHPGRILLRIHFSRYWTLARGAACVTPAGEWTEVVAQKAGVVRLGVALFGGKSANCTTGKT